MAEMKKCKECGKLFMPKGRESYCSDIHYRPCPICGCPVEAKYLSDPPRRCANCKGKSKPIQPAKPTVAENESSQKKVTMSSKLDMTKPVTTKIAQPHVLMLSKEQTVTDNIPSGFIHPDVEITPGSDIREYIGKVFKNSFIPGHVYSISVDKEQYAYCISSVFDLSTNEPVDKVIMLSSTISINQHFRKVDEQ